MTRMDSTTKNNRKATAYHEAGHAVVSLHFNLPFESISVIEDKKSLGRYSRTFDQLPFDFNDFESEIDEFVKADIICDFAGISAETKFTGVENVEGAEQDFTNAVDKAFRLLGNGDDAYTLQIELRRQSELLFTNEHGDHTNLWKIVGLMAQELFMKKTLLFKECQEIYCRLK